MTYWPIDGNQICTLWLALDTVTADSGAVEYVKGSHKWGQKFKPETFSGGNQYTENLPKVPNIEDQRDEFEFIQFIPGTRQLHPASRINRSRLVRK
jgi:ectoine hydroxylase-related dioxygenase (phytanoyl-CoA dioxygenase family)